MNYANSDSRKQVKNSTNEQMFKIKKIINLCFLSFSLKRQNVQPVDCCCSLRPCPHSVSLLLFPKYLFLPVKTKADNKVSEYI